MDHLTLKLLMFCRRRYKILRHEFQKYMILEKFEISPMLIQDFVLFLATYYHNIVEALEHLGYKRNKTIRGAPFDFRKAPSKQ